MMQSTGVGDFGEFNWPLMWMLAIAWLLVGIALIRGIRYVGKVLPYSVEEFFQLRKKSKCKLQLNYYSFSERSPRSTSKLIKTKICKRKKTILTRYFEIGNMLILETFIKK